MKAAIEKLEWEGVYMVKRIIALGLERIAKLTDAAKGQP